MIAIGSICFYCPRREECPRLSKRVLGNRGFIVTVRTCDKFLFEEVK